MSATKSKSRRFSTRFSSVCIVSRICGRSRSMLSGVNAFCTRRRSRLCLSPSLANKTTRRSDGPDHRQLPASLAGPCPCFGTGDRSEAASLARNHRCGAPCCLSTSDERQKPMCESALRAHYVSKQMDRGFHRRSGRLRNRRFTASRSFRVVSGRAIPRWLTTRSASWSDQNPRCADASPNACTSS